MEADEQGRQLAYFIYRDCREDYKAPDVKQRLRAIILAGVEQEGGSKSSKATKSLGC